MASTTRLALYQPIGTLKATSTANGTTTTLLCSNAEAAGLVADNTVIYRLYTAALALKEDTNFTVLTVDVDTPGAGTSTVTLGQTAGGATATTDTLYRADVINVTTALNNQLNTLDTNWDALVCTSSTRPASPFQGQLIFETDTQFLMQWDGSAWLYVSCANRARGWVAETNRDAVGTTVTVGDAEHDTAYQVTFTAEADRRYKIMSHINFDKTAGSIPNSPYFKVRFRWATGAAVGVSDTLAAEFVQDIIENAEGNSIRGTYVFPFIPAVSGQITLGVTLVASSPGGAAGRIAATFSQIQVFDIGEV